MKEEQLDLFPALKDTVLKLDITYQGKLGNVLQVTVCTSTQTFSICVPATHTRSKKQITLFCLEALYAMERCND